MSGAKPYDLFAVAAPGLERVVASELRALGFADALEVSGGVCFRGSMNDAFRANLWLRCASRVLVRLGSFPAPGKRELIGRVRKVDLSSFVPPGMALHVEAASQQSRLYHTGLVEEAVREALGCPAPADAKSGAPVLYDRLSKDRCTLSLDTSGELLHRRGYRLATSRAPLRETLAAGLLLLGGYDGSQPLVDPMCGSGTIVIEAALLASGRAVNADRAMAMERFANVAPAELDAISNEAKAARRPGQAVIVGSDIHAGALHAARTNAERAGVIEQVRFERADVAQLEPPGGDGVIITNPPYGKRVANDRPNRADPLSALESALKGRFASWDRFVLAPGDQLRRSVRIPAVRMVRLENGGLPVEFVQYRRRSPAASS